MIKVSYNDITKKLNVSINDTYDKIIEKNNYIMFFCNGILIQYIIKNYNEKKYIYHKKIQKFLNKPIYKYMVK